MWHFRLPRNEFARSGAMLENSRIRMHAQTVQAIDGQLHKQFIHHPIDRYQAQPRPSRNPFIKDGR